MTPQEKITALQAEIEKKQADMASGQELLKQTSTPAQRQMGEAIVRAAQNGIVELERQIREIKEQADREAQNAIERERRAKEDAERAAKEAEIAEARRQAAASAEQARQVEMERKRREQQEAEAARQEGLRLKAERQKREMAEVSRRSAEEQQQKQRASRRATLYGLAGDAGKAGRKFALKVPGGRMLIEFIPDEDSPDEV